MAIRSVKQIDGKFLPITSLEVSQTTNRLTIQKIELEWVDYQAFLKLDTTVQFGIEGMLITNSNWHLYLAARLLNISDAPNSTQEALETVRRLSNLLKEIMEMLSYRCQEMNLTANMNLTVAVQPDKPDNYLEISAISGKIIIKANFFLKE